MISTTDLSQFAFRNNVYSCNVYIDRFPAVPFYVFVDLIDKELIDEFGAEVSIKTDFEKRLPKDDDYPTLIELRQAIFNVIKNNPEFLTTKSKTGTYVSQALHP